MVLPTLAGSREGERVEGKTRQRSGGPAPEDRPPLLSSVARAVLAVGITASVVLALSRPADESLAPGVDVAGAPTSAPTAEVNDALPTEGSATEAPSSEGPTTEAPASQAAEPPDEHLQESPTEPSPEPPDSVEPPELPEPPAQDPADGILAAAPHPSVTTVQVLDGVGDRRRAAAAAERLDELGYRVVARNPAGLDYAESVVQVTAGHESAGRALQVREPRVGALDDNRNLSRDVDLHLIVGADWPR